jgi:hypothetical protein
MERIYTGGLKNILAGSLEIMAERCRIRRYVHFTYSCLLQYGGAMSLLSIDSGDLFQLVVTFCANGGGERAGKK